MLKTIKINGRAILVPEGFTIRKLKDGQFCAEYNGRSHYITGGKAAGGSAREWFVDGFGGNSIRVTGLRDGVNLMLGA